MVDGGVGTVDIANDAVTGAKVLDGTLTSADLGNASVDTGELVDGGVGTVDIADDAVTTAKLLDGAVTGAKVLDGTLTTADIAQSVWSGSVHCGWDAGGPAGRRCGQRGLLVFRDR